MPKRPNENKNKESAQPKRKQNSMKFVLQNLHLSERTIKEIEALSPGEERKLLDALREKHARDDIAKIMDSPLLFRNDKELPDEEDKKNIEDQSFQEKP